MQQEGLKIQYLSQRVTAICYQRNITINNNKNPQKLNCTFDPHKADLSGKEKHVYFRARKHNCLKKY